MEYKTPKVLEKKPVIAGFDLLTIVVIVISVLVSVFAVMSSILVAITSISLGAAYVYLGKKYPKKGQLATLLKYTSGAKCIHGNQQIKSLVKRS